MLLTDAVPKPTFANHESFHLRYGWLKKAYNATLDDPRVFVSEESPIKLGVGKNMVRSIRFWALACKIIEPKKGPSNPDVCPTEMGRAIFDDVKGLDPYLEHPQTMWLIHWLLLAPPCRIPVWWLVLNEFAATNIRTTNVTESVQHRIVNMSEWKTPSPKSVKKDIDVFLHTYTTERGKMTIEDYLDCPFRQMHMIMQDAPGMMRFVFGIKDGMTPHVAAFACLDFINRLKISSKSISVMRLATESGGVGNAFKISENDLVELLAEACKTSVHMRMENVNGAQYLTFDDVHAAIDQVLQEAYDKPSFRIRRKEIEVLASS